jgi:MFS family permease
VSPWRRVADEWREGLAVVRQDRALSVLFVAWALSGLAEGIFLTLGLSPLVLDVLGGTPAQVGWLGTAQAVGGLIAGVLVAQFAARLATRWLVGGGLVGVGLADLGTANARLFAPPGLPAVAVAMGWQALAGAPVVANGAGRQAVVQTRAGDAYRGRVFGALGAVVGGAMLIGYALGGVLGGTTGIVPTLSAGALLRVGGGLLALWLLPRFEETPSISSLPPIDNLTY